jgi:hypothetical protein
MCENVFDGEMPRQEALGAAEFKLSALSGGRAEKPTESLANATRPAAIELCAIKPRKKLL